jgi:bacillopeptidase F
MTRITSKPVAAAPATPPADKPARGRGKEPQFNEFLVLLDDQANRTVEKAFDMPVGDERRRYVAQNLYDTMKRTQAPLWDVLDGLQAAGHVGDYKPLWIQNAIVVKGDAEAEAVMSYAAGVAQAVRSATHTLSKPAFEAGTFGGEFGPPAGSPVTPDDPQWNMTRMHAERAAKQGLDGRGVTVGIIDTGVDFNHPHLKDKYVGYDQRTGHMDHTIGWHDSDEPVSPEPVDVGLHGTHVAGTVGGYYNGDQTGLGHGAKMMAARGLGEHGGTDGMLLTAFQAMVAPKVPTPGTAPGWRREIGLGADVINNSWGSADGLSMSYTNALRNMAAMGVVNLFAAGNEGQGGKPGSIGSPASSPYIISVGATDKDDAVADFSSRGPNPLPTPDGEPVPFVSAPGVDIRSTVPGGGLEDGWPGTSMATPAVTGWVTLAQQAAMETTGNKFDVFGIKDMLRRSTEDIDAKGVDDNSGYGVVVVPSNMRKLAEQVAVERGLIKPEAKAGKGDAAAEGADAPAAPKAPRGRRSRAAAKD